MITEAEYNYTESESEASVYAQDNEVSQTPVEVDALVLLKVMRHCRKHFPTPVNGLLIGLDKENVLEITDCFGLQNKRDLWNQLSREKLDLKEVDDKVSLEDMRYQMKMLEQLYLVNADCCNVGWYQSLQFEHLKDQSIIEGLCDYREGVKDAVMIGYDPQLAKLGMEAFRAYRITDPVLKSRLESERGDTLNGQLLNSNLVLVEVPIVVRNSLLNQTFLADWFNLNKEFENVGEWSPLEAGDKTLYMQKQIDFVSSCLDDLQVEQDKYMRYLRDSARITQKHKELIERRKLENEQRLLRKEELLPEVPLNIKRPEPPNQLPTLLLANHVNRIITRLSNTIGENIVYANLLYNQLCENE